MGKRYRDLSCFDEHIENLIARMPINGDVDLQPLFFDFTLDVATSLLSSDSVYSLRARSTKRRKMASSLGILIPLKQVWVNRFRKPLLERPPIY